MNTKSLALKDKLIEEIENYNDTLDNYISNYKLENVTKSKYIKVTKPKK